MTTDYSTYLVQRLRHKPRSEQHALVSQVFGGGMTGISKEGWKVIQGLFDLDYMGAAEFEFGAIPKTLKSLAADHERLIGFEIRLTREDIPVRSDREWRAKIARKQFLDDCRRKGIKAPRAKKPSEEPPFEPKSLFIICRSEHREVVEARARALVKKEIRTKEHTGLPESLDPITEYDAEIIGGLELDNGWFYFVNRAVYVGTRDAFGATEIPRE